MVELHLQPSAIGHPAIRHTPAGWRQTAADPAQETRSVSFFFWGGRVFTKIFSVISGKSVYQIVKKS